MMAEEITRCEYSFKVSDGIPRTCSRPARRVSKGRHYCREHFDAVIDEAKSEVVKETDAFLREKEEAHHVDSQAYTLTKAMKHLKALGWEPGD